jgi:hypothetical protein
MMRKLIVLLTVLLPVFMTKAQDKPIQAPIVAFVDHELYLVSPDDGSAMPLVEPTTPLQFISPISAGSLSPDSKQLSYVSYIPVNTSTTTEPQNYDLFLATLADGTIEKITPSGGLFDVAAQKGQIFTVDTPTWSWDGQRIYYFRAQFDIRNHDRGARQLAYYDIAAHKHQLVARIDPKTAITGLQAVASGMLLKWQVFRGDKYITGTLYLPNNKAVKQPATDQYSANAIHDSDGDYLVREGEYGDIDSMLNVATGAETRPDVGNFPSIQSFANGEHSMHVFGSLDTLTNSIFGTDDNAYITRIDSEGGVSFAIAPDGQELAYLQYEFDQKVPIRIIDINGNTREFDFKAEKIVWGATVFVPFFLHG